jgi:hypothetical protein
MGPGAGMKKQTRKRWLFITCLAAATTGYTASAQPDLPPTPRSDVPSRGVPPLPSGNGTPESRVPVVPQDGLLSWLESLKVPEWQCQPAQVFLSVPDGFKSRTNQPLPPDQLPAVLQEFGCTQIILKDYTRPQRAVRLAVYTFASPEGAYGAYSTMRRGSSTVVLRGDASSEDDSSISFWQGRRFITMTETAEEDDMSKRLMSSLSDQLAARLVEHSAKPELIEALPVVDRVAGSERFYMGACSACRLALPNQAVLSLQKCAGAAFAQYQFARPMAERLKVLLVDYKDQSRAYEVFSAYSAVLSSTHKMKQIEPTTLLGKVSDAYLLCSLKGQRLLIISGARRKTSPLLISRAVR